MKTPSIGWTLGNPIPSYRKARALQVAKRIIVALVVALGLLAVMRADFIDLQASLIH